jgi:hypothetical protein
MPIFIVSLLIQLALVVHVIKTGRSTIWVFILIFAPLIGGLAYFIVEILPELMNSGGARKAQRAFSRAVNPDKDLRAATQTLEVADTVQNAMALAEQCLERGHFAEARELYARCLKGLHADDPVLLLGLARTQFGLEDYHGAAQSLDTLKEKNPEYKSTDGHLLYARTKERLGEIEAAIHEYEVLASYYPGPEPACRLGLILKSQGKIERAKELFQRVINQSKIAGRHYNSIHKEWVALAKREAI